MASKQITVEQEQLEALEYELARRDYTAYVRMVHEGHWQASRFGRFICQAVQRFIEHKSNSPYEILVLSVSPQHGKSQAVTETLPSWYLGKHPRHKVIEISYNEEFARRFGRRNKEKIANFGGKAFGIALATRPNSETEFELSNHAGSMISRGVNSGVTGRPCNLMIIDDPIKSAVDADSELKRNRLWEEWQNSYKTRLAPGAKVILIQTRWHEDDLAGRIIQREQGVQVINLPCEAEKDDPMGRKPGEPLHPEIGKDAQWLRKMKASIVKGKGSRTWESLYQGHPTAAQGNLIKREWWRFYQPGQLPSPMVQVMSVDATFKDSDRADFVAIQVWGKGGANYYLLDRVKARMDFISTLNRIKYMRRQHNGVSAIFIEDKANGPAIINMLKRDIPGIIPIKPEGSKEARVQAVSPAIEAGNVLLPANAAWTDEFIEEFAAFPHGANDDEVDACSQALNRLIYTYTKVEAPSEEDMEQFLPTQRVIGTRVNIRSLFR